MWDHPNPVLLDFETQSAADITQVGGRVYAYHPSTRILILSVYADGEYHAWIPDHIRVDSINKPDLWPHELKPRHPVTLHRGKVLPPAIAKLCHNRPLVAHNAYGFDKHVWDRFIGLPRQWIDTLYLSRIAGLPGGLDKLAMQVLGVGKDRAKKLLPLLTTAKPSLYSDGYTYPAIKSGDLVAFTRYAIADVEILRRLLETFHDLDVEEDVIEAHNHVNERGVMVDVPLLRTIERLSTYSTNTAAKDIAHMTGGKIPPDKLRSTKVVHEWLQSYGVCIVDEQRKNDDGSPKASLRKEVVQRYIDSPYVVEDNLYAVKEIPPVVIDVLKLRMKALRITDAKVTRAQAVVGKDKRIRDLISYHVAHTGRFSSQYVQIHNLPRPDKWFSDNARMVLDSINHDEPDVKVLYDSIRKLLPVVEPGRKYVTVDDVLSGLIRPCIMAKKGHVFIIADYSQVEACGIAGIADERKLINLFRAFGDPYRQFAARVYGKDEKDVTDDERQVGKVGILGLGYGMGAEKLRIFAANMGVDLIKAGVTAQMMVDMYRDTYTRIAGWKPDKNASFRVGGVWKDLNKAVMECVGNRDVTSAGRCTFMMKGTTLQCHLPSGRIIQYPDARIEDVIPPYVYTLNLPPIPKATCLYTSARGPKSLFGGLIAENIVQAISRDLMAVALVRLDKMNYNPVLHVHDEILCEVPVAKADRMLEEMVRVMVDPPAWAGEWFPIAAEGYVSPRFVKKAWKGFHKFHSKELSA